MAVTRKKRNIEVSQPQNDVLTARNAIIAEIAGQGAGKTADIGWLTGWMITTFPEAKGFIGANTNAQLSGSTLSRVFFIFEHDYGMTEYDAQTNPSGFYVVGKQPPKNAGWKKANFKFKHYNDVMIFKNGCVVYLGSLENYKAHDGKEFAWAHLDETKDTKKDALTAVILGRLRQYGLWVHEATGNVVWAPMPDVAPDLRAAIAQRQGLRSWNPCYIHTSPAEGTVEWLIELLGIKPYEKEIRKKITKGAADYFYKEIGNKTVIIYPTQHNEHNLPPDYISNRKENLSASEYLKFICGYPFGRNGGEYYPGFDRVKQVGKYEYKKGLAIHTAWDFNATPYVTLLCAHIEYINRWYDKGSKMKYDEPTAGAEPMEVLRFTFFREYCMLHPRNRTEDTANEFADDYEKDKPDIFINGDASGHTRIEGMGSLTQYNIIENAWAGRFYLGNGYMRARRVNIRVQQRMDLMNKIWEGKLPEIEILIDEENCPNLIRDCEYLLQGKDGGKHKEKEKDKNGIEFEKLGHTSDALEYIVCENCREWIKGND